MRLMSVAMMLLLALATRRRWRRNGRNSSARRWIQGELPGKPKMTPTTYESEYGAPLPAHVYAARTAAASITRSPRWITARSNNC
jgi:hypothetical protein